jgi:hypothetical protein
MSKMGSHCSFGHLKHKLWPKEGSRVKLPVWLPTKKSRESTRFTWLQITCNILLKSSRRELQLCFRLHLDPRYARKVMRLQSRESPRWGDFHLDVGPVERCIVYYKGEGGGFPQVQAVVSLVCLCCPWLVLAPKVLQLCTNHFVWVVCKPMWVSEACQLFLVPSRSSNMPLYPSKCCELGSVPRLLLLPLSFTWTHIWILQGVGNASNTIIYKYIPKKKKCITKTFQYQWIIRILSNVNLSIENFIHHIWGHCMFCYHQISHLVNIYLVC